MKKYKVLIKSKASNGYAGSHSQLLRAKSRKLRFYDGRSGSSFLAALWEDCFYAGEYSVHDASPISSLFYHLYPDGEEK